MTSNDKLKILDGKRKTNQDQYDLEEKQLKFLHYHLKN